MIKILRRYSYWVIGCSCLLLTSLHAQSTLNLYQVAVPVTNRSAPARQAAIQHALTVILIKISGNADVASVPQVKTRLRRANTLVQQYSYLLPTLTSPDPIDLQLQVQFDPTAVNKLLTDAGQAVWPNQRPRIAVWLAVINDNERLVLTNDNITNQVFNAATNSLQRIAEQRGIPIVLPSSALIEQQSISFADVYTLSRTTLMPSVGTLQADALLIGRIIQRDSDQWQASWSFVVNDELMQWQTDGTDLQMVFSHMIADVADSLLQRFAVLTDVGTQQRVMLTIEHIEDANTYARVINYLNQLPLVSQVDTVDVTDDHIVVAISADGGQQALQQAVNFGHVLIPIQKTPDVSQPIRYRVAS